MDKPIQTSEAARIFNRPEARIADVLIDLKKSNKIKNFRVESKSYWIRKDKKTIIISNKKNKYLELINKRNLKTSEIAKHFGVDWKSS